MSKSWVLAVLAAAFVGVAVRAQDVNVASQKVGKQRITEFTPAPDLANPPAGAPAGEFKKAELLAKTWICGKQFTDDRGTIWRLRTGPAESAKPNKVTGWLIHGKDNSVVFVSVNSGVFAPYVVPVGTPPLKKLVDALNPKDQR